MVKVNVLNPTGVDIQTPSERDTGHVDVGVQKNVVVGVCL